MRIAVTADLHLPTRKEPPERFAALEDILRQCGRRGVDWLIIAGDLFDHSRQHFADFEKAYKAAHPAGLPVTVIPGNHDPGLKAGALAVEGLEVVSEPTLRPRGGRPPPPFGGQPQAAALGLGQPGRLVGRTTRSRPRRAGCLHAAHP